MKGRFSRRSVGAGLLALAGMWQTRASATAAAPAASGVRARIDELLSAYAANRYDGVLAMLDPQGWVVLGSDIAEIVRSPEALRDLMRADFALWRSAAFSNLRDLDIQADRAWASAIFHIDFSAGGRPPVPVRFYTTWCRVQGTWLLKQCASTVPTVGSSAAALLRGSAG